MVRGARGEEKDSSGPSVIMREAKDLVKEINLRIEEARKDKEAEDKEEEEKAKAEENSMASRTTVSTSEHEGPPRGSNLTMSWTEGEETSSDSNNGMRKRAWTRGYLAFSAGLLVYSSPFTLFIFPFLPLPLLLILKRM